jgi:dCTP deaminase
MAFWSGEELFERLPDLIDPFRVGQLDCASYTLTIGHEVYVSPADAPDEPKFKTKQQLADEQAFRIPPGQFAFLLTEETVAVPPDAVAFISMKASIKFQGLVNVSGFHVDPGFRGQLVFAVFNAGPSIVHLQQGQKCFLIWYASLDRVSKYIKHDPARRGIAPSLISSVSVQVHSVQGLADQVRGVERSLGDRMHALERSVGDQNHQIEQSLNNRMAKIENAHAYIRWGVYFASAVFLLVVGTLIRGWWEQSRSEPPAVTASQPASFQGPLPALTPAPQAQPSSGAVGATAPRPTTIAP